MALLRVEQLRQARARYNATAKGQAAKAMSRANYRAERKTSRRFSRKLKREERRTYPFVGCDGEGITVDGVHSYSLFRMGPRELFNGGARLTTPELLAFILDHPRKTDILVGFSFEYDITSILVDLPVDRRSHLLETYRQLAPAAGVAGAPRPPGFAKRWTWATFEGWGTFGLNWLSRNHLSVCRPHPLGATDPRYRNASDRNSIRTIYDTFGFFQASFVRSLRAWEIGGDRVDRIEKMKEARSSFETVTDDIRAYNADECTLLAQTMEKFRTVCQDIGIAPRTWNGAGKIASFLHETNGTLRKRDIASLVKRGVIEMAHAAYYGGRFEITRAGLICEPVYEHDINSAYPAMMRKLPCLNCGKWAKASGDTLRDLDTGAIFVCPVSFTHHGGIDRRGRPVAGEHQFLCGFPFRSAGDGRLCWPREGKGVYWSPEIRSAERLGASCAYHAGWLYVPSPECKCRPFAWVEELYHRRKSLPDLQGKPIKLGINALYGKLAQRIGDPQYANPVWAGLITAMTRAALNDAILAAGQRNVIMIATDAIYTVGHPVPARAAFPGDGLGQWSVKTLSSIFIVQPGLYWSPGKVRSRGISASVIRSGRHDYTRDFELAWEEFAASEEALRYRDFPAVKVAFTAFIGLRLAGHWNKPDLAGQWLDQVRELSFDWTGKRDGHEWSSDCKHVILGAPDGHPSYVSAHYEEGGTLTTSEGWEVERMLLEAMPDFVPLSDADD